MHMLAGTYPNLFIFNELYNSVSEKCCVTVFLFFQGY